MRRTPVTPRLASEPNSTTEGIPMQTMQHLTDETFTEVAAVTTLETKAA
jgi:hypothetical protein